MIRRDTSDKLRVKVGDRIRLERLAHKMTQTELARITSMNQGHLSEIEHGRENLTLDTICVLAEALGLEPVITFVRITPPSSSQTGPGARRAPRKKIEG